MGLYQLGVLTDNVLECGDRKVAKHVPDLGFGTFQVDVGLESAAGAHRQARMRGINLSRMNIEGYRPAFGQHLARLALDEPVGEEAQVSATEEAHRLAHEFGN